MLWQAETYIMCHYIRIVGFLFLSVRRILDKTGVGCTQDLAPLRFAFYLAEYMSIIFMMTN